MWDNLQWRTTFNETLNAAILRLAELSPSLCCYFILLSFIGNWQCFSKRGVVTVSTRVICRVLARACGIQVGWRSGSRLAMTSVATINDIFFFSPPSSTFLIEVLRSKNLYRQVTKKNTKGNKYLLNILITDGRHFHFHSVLTGRLQDHPAACPQVRKESESAARALLKC